MSKPQIILDAIAKETGPLFQGLPERWLDDPTWRCENGHVSKRFLKSDGLGRDACLECHGKVWLTFPGDGECDHEFEWDDQSFSHEFGTEEGGLYVCRKCGKVADDRETREMEDRDEF